MHVRSIFVISSLLIVLALCGPAFGGGKLLIDCAKEATVFKLWELKVEGATDDALAPQMPEAQVHDAYDADRDGVWVSLVGEFTHAKSKTRMLVPGFAMREAADGPWSWRVRWSPTRPGKWQAMITLGYSLKDPLPSTRRLKATCTIMAKATPKVEGPLVMPRKGENPNYLRTLKSDGSSEALWLFGTCRAWVVSPNNGTWGAEEWIDRDKELLAPMRKAGFNLLNQWMAPWEYQLVHRDRAEHWRSATGRWRRHALPENEEGLPFQRFDQGRARAFDALVRQCEGGPGKPLIRLLLAPIAHHAFLTSRHPWGLQESGWRAVAGENERSAELLNGFSAFREGMTVWEFFQADPTAPLMDWRSKLFDYQATFFRYCIARWGYSSALGMWVIMDEVDGVGDDIGSMAQKRGWWLHPQCHRWLGNMHRLFRGTLQRSDKHSYIGDPWRHPLHSAATSEIGQAERGANLDWDGGPPGARVDVHGWHWYPYWMQAVNWPDAWGYVIDGVLAYSSGPIRTMPKLISEYGFQERYDPGDEPSRLYPTAFHHAIWAAVLSGQAGIPMDWDDGKEFGELTGRKRKGAFDKAHYPIDKTAHVVALRRFLKGLKPDDLTPCRAKGTAIRTTTQLPTRACALFSRKGGDRVYGWIYAPGKAPTADLHGVMPGKYMLAWFDPWTGKPIQGLAPREITVAKGAKISLHPGKALEFLRRGLPAFPAETRADRGRDIAFKLVPDPRND
jgi:hypothetical protein